MSQSQTDFLASEYAASPPEQAAFHVLPVPLEQTVSYGLGTVRGPQAILDASYQLEAFDGFDCPGDAGIYTAEPVDCSGSIAACLDRIEAAARSAWELQKIPVLLGGEHSLTLGAVRALLDRQSSFGVVQFDAHADLRDVYDGTPYSHACVMRRVAELGIPIFQIGVRSLCLEEIEYRAGQNIRFLDGRQIGCGTLPDRLLPEDFPTDIYLSFDLDGLDSALMPATGTPEPGGLTWWQAMTIVQRIVAEGGRLLGFDVVELAPIAGLHAPDYTAAKLAYGLMGFALRSNRREA